MIKKIPKIYQLKVSLDHSKPPIWRRLLVSEETELDELHHIIQIAMGWMNAHLHHFIVDNTYYGMDMSDFGMGISSSDQLENGVQLRKIAPKEKSKFYYEYDFGDSWLHTILVEKILPPNPEQSLPQCIKGKRACPPEDVGGIYGYYEFLEAIKDSKHPNHEMFMDWVDGETIDPESFDLNAVNAELEKFVKNTG